MRLWLVSAIFVYAQTIMAAAFIRDDFSHEPLQPQVAIPLNTSCNVNFTSSQIDYGVYFSAQLRPYGHQALTFGKRNLSLSSICPQIRTMQFRLGGDANASGTLRFGRDGVLSVNVSDAIVDGRSVLLSKVNGDGLLLGAAAASLSLQAGDVFVLVNNSGPVDGRHATVSVEVEAFLPQQEASVRQQEIKRSILTIEMP